jgi:uncharacterized lipoprotein YmbA
MRPFTLHRLILLVVLGLGAAACALLQPQPDPTQFFVLSPLASSGSGASTASGRPIGVGPIALPKYLDRANIVRRVADSRVVISELEWWAEPLESNIMRVMADNLAARLGTSAVLRYPWPLSLEPAYAVSISFGRFDIVLPDRVQLAAQWVVRGGAPRRVLLTRESIIDKPTASPRTGDAVDALSRALDDLSGQIASAIETLPAQAPPAKPTPRRGKG